MGLGKIYSAAGREDVHVRLYLLRVRMLLNACREGNGIVRHMDGG